VTESEQRKRDDASRIVVGKIAGVFGVRGWVKVISYTDPREGILDYSPWMLEHGGAQEMRKVLDGRVHGAGIVAQLERCTDRDQAAALMNATVSVERSQLPEAAEGEYYWADLVGLEVVTTQGVSLGRVAELFETGANDVLVVRGDRERLIPFIRGQVIKDIDLKARRMQVDWDPEF
jgi:16S rRNA processing protein RimM